MTVRTGSPALRAPAAQEARLRWGAWFDETDMTVDFPAGWEVRVHRPAGGRDIGRRGIEEALGHPIGTPRIRDLAKGKRRPCIVVDDLSRPTPAHRILPAILAELALAGIAAEDVLILAGVANHRPMMREDFVKKCGAEIVRRCRTKSHFSWDDCVYVGTTSGGIPVSLNRDFMDSDLRILLGSIVPHSVAGFAGGGKLVLPGVASIETATSFHGPQGPSTGLGHIPPARLVVEEAARMAGVDCIVNVVPNPRRGIAALVVGDLVEAHREGIRHAKDAFRTKTPTNVDVCVLSAYPKDNEFLQHTLAFGIWASAAQPIAHEEGTVVVATASSEGPGFHSLAGPGMPLPAAEDLRRPVAPRDLTFFAPGVNKGDVPAATTGDVQLFERWVDVRKSLKDKHGRKARVAVFPCASIQLAEAACD
jgi:nickel-dependent lactate racemase